MNPSIAEQLAGYQHIVTGIVQEGDKVTFIPGGSPERVVMDADVEVGLTVESARAILDVSVYRKIPVAKQGDLDHVVLESSPGMPMFCPAPRLIGSSFIPQGDTVRKGAPMFRGLLGYFPAALFEVASHSMDSDRKHNPGSKDGPTWARGKSFDHADCIVRHLVDAGQTGTPARKTHLRALAWRALALLQEECELQGAAPGVSSRP